MTTNVRNISRSPDVSWLVAALRRILRPVIRLCVGRLSCPNLVAVVRQLYIEEGRRELSRQNNGKQTKSALSLLTGLDYRAIEGIEKEQGDQFESSDISPEASILSTWYREETFRDPETDAPRLLPVLGKGITFQTLVMRCAGRSVTAHSVLQKLLDSGNVAMTEDGQVELREWVYFPFSQSQQATFEILSASWSRLGKAVTHNATEDLDPDDRWLQQDRWTHRLPPEKREQFRKDLRALLESHIVEAEEVMEEFEAPVQQSNHICAGVGWYYWEEPEE